jgi:hypothetical protein
VLFQALDAEELGQDRLLGRLEDPSGGYTGPLAVWTATTSWMSTVPASR